MKDIFRYQIWHLISALLLVALAQHSIFHNPAGMVGEYWGVTTQQWFWIAISVPLLHQLYVWLIWRLELYYSTFTSRFGLSKSFALYAVGFSLLFVGRLIAITILALSSSDSLTINPYYSYLLAAVITPVVIYLFYSVKRYFTFSRALGIDHFDKNYDEPYVKGGIFRYSDNAMYLYGLMVLYLPGLLLLSKAALIVALFNHIYIWGHYFCTERPDMQVIYGKLPHEPLL